MLNHEWKNIAVRPDATMREVLALIDKTAMQIALVVDDACHLTGTITDGDIRRALLKGENLDTAVHLFMNPNAVTGLVDEDPLSWQRAMQRHSLKHLPLLDASGCIRALARLEIPQEPKRENRVVLMAGGLGTRLRPLTQSKPKPLLTVGDRPIIETIIENFAQQGFYQFTLCINYQGEKIKAYCGDGNKWGVQIDYVEESKRLGTAGALALLSERPDLPFFVMNGDLLTKVDFVRFLDFHKKQDNHASMCVREYRYQIPYGVVDLDQHKIVQLREKPVFYHNVNAGIYLLNPEVLQLIPRNTYFDMPQLFDHLISESYQAGSFPLREYWMDVGRMEDFHQAHSDYIEQFG
ncbi:MAG: nucleotidyltransferase family protein [Gammaproteobacteria bacterium]|nr:nucleotidyltransferase family protein [Gammaproteobacteria bacterium]MDH5801331.1 nucleotidyltransferase family protein [Gammaproteobacteria bacterium]